MSRLRLRSGGATKIGMLLATAMLAIVVSGCASQTENTDAADRPDCPDHQTMTCYGRTAGETVCRCTERREMQVILEDSIRRDIP